MANLEDMKEKFIVIKNEDITKHLDVDQQMQLTSLLILIKIGRAKESKTINNKYLVINTDEQYTDEVIETLKKNGHWG
jgi:hypothetical protein